jgi:hypothetical protein
MRGAATLGFAFALLVMGCRREARDRITAAPEHVPSGVPAKIETVDALIGHAGETVTVEGRAVEGKLEHMTKVVGKTVLYIELLGSKTEIVAYVPTIPACDGPALFTGKVIVVTGMAKGPHGGGAYAETQLDVDRASCR